MWNVLVVLFSCTGSGPTGILGATNHRRFDGDDMTGGLTLIPVESLKTKSKENLFPGFAVSVNVADL